MHARHILIITNALHVPSPLFMFMLASLALWTRLDSFPSPTTLTQRHRQQPVRSCIRLGRTRIGCRGRTTRQPEQCLYLPSRSSYLGNVCDI
ncbi:hypothetical protein F4818DRAFT_404699 [Hypoxylon cercidicola]|nr:hypothetical protein F4818DRAFT_404699 [Hypoxylon cercidicola]